MWATTIMVLKLMAIITTAIIPIIIIMALVRENVILEAVAHAGE